MNLQTWESLGDGKIRCTACCHRCTLNPGQSGICGVRMNRDGQLFSPVYGRAIAVHVDPVEKKPLHHFLPGTPIFSVGTIGCNMKCDFCQNWDISQLDQIQGAKTRNGDIEDSALGKHLSPQDILQTCIRTRAQSVAFTYNEPTIFVDYAIDTARLVHPQGIRTVFVTNGFETPETVEKLAGLIDAFNVDVKAFKDSFYRKHCKASLQPVLDTVVNAKRRGIWVETTTLLIPGENDSEEELDELTKWHASVDPLMPWHISAFHPDFQLTNVGRTPLSTLQRAYEIGKRNGLKFIYMGNVGGQTETDTYCPSCGERLIHRDGMRQTTILKSFNANTGTCAKCGTTIPGVWK
ncbi:AmmeMemoRadiSam system radical SAM enzyme [Blattamonas nauphoetae]|uniref:AmmeMemoRadiSam system radical SAM enzyme n=1 Tax=Blattamonas nauphoetae TaxID=2049346 RepID=A0ABQ9Y1T6_9EUKA|nr:AmmeMemoRadiSam system radical SAM enzyme [Blattamonas nauphoetae]